MAFLQCSTCGERTETKEENVGKAAKCPNCGELGRVQEDPLAVAQMLQEREKHTTGKLTLASGESIEFNAVYMYPAEALMQLEELRITGETKLTPRSSGIGFIGSLGAVVAASAGLGLLEGAVNSVRGSKGQSLLSEYYKHSINLKYQGRFVPVCSINHVQLADPSLWLGVYNDIAYSLADDPFICVRKSAGDPASIRWSLVEQFWVNAME